MYSIANLTVSEYLEKLAVPTFPGPASGSAAATVAAMAAALLEMSCGATIKKDEQKRTLMRSFENIEAIRKQCLFLASEDMKAYAEVVKAAKSKKEDPENYEVVLEKATDTLAAIVKNCDLILTQIEQVAKISYIKALGDLAGGACLAEAAAEAAKLGVEVNLKLLHNENYKKETKHFVRESYKKCTEIKHRIISALA